MTTHRPRRRAIGFVPGLLAIALGLTRPTASPGAEELPLGQAAEAARYVLDDTATPAATSVRMFTVGWGGSDAAAGEGHRWLSLRATKNNGQEFGLWLLTQGYPADAAVETGTRVSRYLVRSGNSAALEFQDRTTGGALLPSLGAWHFLLPRPVGAVPLLAPGGAFPREVDFLGHRYHQVEDGTPVALPPPPEARVIRLRPDALVGLPGNTRPVTEGRRYDGSEYPMRPLTREDYREMAESGMNCLRVDAGQRAMIEDLAAFYWGPGGADLPFPESLYDSRYLGPGIFLDEPAVHTRDYVIRPRLAKEPALARGLTVESVLDAFRQTFDEACRTAAPTVLLAGLAARQDVDLGAMKFPQANLFCWETMISTAAYELSHDPLVPAALVLEPPGHVGTLRTLPEFDMAYGCQIPCEDPKYLTDILFGLLRGGARATGKEWGVSIYGAVDRADAPWWFTRAYDLGATRFFMWDNSGIACVPHQECLDLARHLRMRQENAPPRDLARLREAAEVLVLLPPGYNLGHVHLGRGNLWGLPELNLERTNRVGVTYREVMGNAFTEMERCLRLGLGFDVLWDLPDGRHAGYREIVRIREDGKVEVGGTGPPTVFEHARVPARPGGPGPALSVSLSSDHGAVPLAISAEAQVTPGAAPVYYTLGADARGVSRNVAVLWELYGPEPQDYRTLRSPEARPAGGGLTSSTGLRLTRPGHYRLRAATVDLAGRSAVRWTGIDVTP